MQSFMVRCAVEIFGNVCRASSVLLFPTFWGLSYFFLLLGKIPTFSGFYLN